MLCNSSSQAVTWTLLKGAWTAGLGDMPVVEESEMC